MQVYVHYNLHGGDPDAHTEFKAQMIDVLGYSEEFRKNNNNYTLPHTALWHPNLVNTQLAIDDLHRVVNEINRTRAQDNRARLLNYVALQFESSTP